MAFEFKDAKVAAKYTTSVEKDVLVHKAGVYSGMLSGINEEMAAGMVARKSNLISLKNPATPSPSSKNEAGAKAAEAGK